MAVGNFTQAELYEEIEGNVHQKFAQVNDRQVTVNRAVRFVNGDVDLRSTKRNSQLSPNLFRDVHDYTAPTDLKQNKIIDIRKQVNRLSSEGWIMVDETDFNRYKDVSDYRIAVADDELVRILKIDGVEGAVNATLHDCNSLTADGTWAVFGASDATNLTIDTDNYITGSGAFNFDTNSGGTTAEILTTNATSVDLTDHDEKSSIFIWVYIPSTTNLTNFIFRWGSDSSNYWSRTVTTNNEGAAFYVGWNLLRFDWNGATETGTCDPSAIVYLDFVITKDAAMAADTDWRVDNIVSRIGDIYNVVYYSKFGWQSSSGTYLEDSTAATDLLNADTNEMELIILKASQFASQELKEYDDAKEFKQQYEEAKAQYETNVPSEALKIHRTYYDAPLLSRGRGWNRISE